MGHSLRIETKCTKRDEGNASHEPIERLQPPTRLANRDSKRNNEGRKARDGHGKPSDHPAIVKSKPSNHSICQHGQRHSMPQGQQSRRLHDLDINRRRCRMGSGRRKLTNSWRRQQRRHQEEYDRRTKRRNHILSHQDFYCTSRKKECHDSRNGRYAHP